jgi:hypothetical protein
MSEDGRDTWKSGNYGLHAQDIWVVKSFMLRSHPSLLAGTSPCHLFISEDEGHEWRELEALRGVPQLIGGAFQPPRTLHTARIFLLVRMAVCWLGSK